MSESNDTRQVDKARMTISDAKTDLWEAPFCCGGDTMVRDAKRASKRAQRRVDKLLILEGIEDWVDENEEENDRLFDQYLYEAYMEAEENETERMLHERKLNRFAFSLLPKGAGFFGDCNGPGVVYWAPEGLLGAAMAALVDNGGDPFEISHETLIRWVTERDHEFMDGWCWSLRRWLNF